METHLIKELLLPCKPGVGKVPHTLKNNQVHTHVNMYSGRKTYLALNIVYFNVGLAVRFRFEAKISETEAKFCSLRSEEKVSFACFHFEVRNKIDMRNEVLKKRNSEII